MITDLPIDDLKLIMQDWSLLNTRVTQAKELLMRESKMKRDDSQE